MANPRSLVPSLARRLLVCGWLLFTLAALTGCAAIRANFAREQALTRELDAYVIAKPLPEVWESVGGVHGSQNELLWNGSTFTWKDAGDWRKRTSSNTDKYDTGEDSHIDITWFTCEGAEVPGGSQVRYYEVTKRTTRRSGGEPTTDEITKRRTDLEIELIERFDPAAAERIRAAGENAAQTELN